MKKKNVVLFIVGMLLVLTACGKKEGDKVEIESEASFYGEVQEVNEENILVQVYDEEGNPEEKNILYVSLDTQLEESDADFEVGDKVTVYYNGAITKSYPGQVNMVYAIIKEKPTKTEKNK